MKKKVKADLKELNRANGYALELIGKRCGVMRRRRWWFFAESDQSLRSRIAWKWFDDSFLLTGV